jgi:cell division protein FtsZ
VYLLGKKTLRGAGSGGDPLIGKASVDEATNDIRSVLENTDILFLVAGLGKGTGSGASPEIAKIANQLGILTIAIVNFPSVNAEGHNVYENALNSFDVLKDEVDSITKISNDRIINNDKSISFVNAFEKANIEVSSVVSDIVDMVDSASNMNLDFSDVRNFFKAHKTFMAGTFELKTEYSHKALDEAIKRSMKASFTDVNIKTGNIKILMNLRISTKVPSSVTNDIRNIFKDVTKDNSLTLVHGIDYVTDESFDGLKASYLVSASDEVLPIEEAPAINFGETVEDKNFNQTSANEDFINFTEYKTVDSDYKTGGVKRETIKFETEEILTDGERFNSREVNKLMTKAINSVMNNNYDSSDMPHKVTSKLH